MADVDRPSATTEWGNDIDKMAPGLPRVVEPFARCFNAISDWINDNTSADGHIYTYQQVLNSLPAAKTTVANIANGNHLNDALMQLQYNAANSPVGSSRIEQNAVGLLQRHASASNPFGAISKTVSPHTFTKGGYVLTDYNTPYTSVNGETLLLVGRFTANTDAGSYMGRILDCRLQYAVSTDGGSTYPTTGDCPSSNITFAAPGWNNSYEAQCVSYLNTVAGYKYKFRARIENISDEDGVGQRFDGMSAAVAFIVPIG